MRIPDLNCDMGEGIGNEEAIMPWITSASIACGAHAGDEKTMRATVLLAKRFGVDVGAHPGFADRAHFGRRELRLGPEDLHRLVLEQVKALAQIAEGEGMKLQHVKPHGALYNLGARETATAAVIARAVKDADPELILFGLSGSHLIREGARAGLRTASEVFADRAYASDGSLVPRSHPGALIASAEAALAQVREMTGEGYVTTLTGNRIPVCAETICIHGDGPQAAEFAKAIRTLMGNIAF